MKYLGLDIGALFTKAVLLDAKGEEERSWVARHHGDPRKHLGDWLAQVQIDGRGKSEGDLGGPGVTAGYGHLVVAPRLWLVGSATYRTWGTTWSKEANESRRRGPLRSLLPFPFPGQ